MKKVQVKFKDFLDCVFTHVILVRGKDGKLYKKSYDCKEASHAYKLAEKEGFTSLDIWQTLAYAEK